MRQRDNRETFPLKWSRGKKPSSGASRASQAFRPVPSDGCSLSQTNTQGRRRASRKAIIRAGSLPLWGVPPSSSGEPTGYPRRPVWLIGADSLPIVRLDRAAATSPVDTTSSRPRSPRVGATIGAANSAASPSDLERARYLASVAPLPSRFSNRTLTFSMPVDMLHVRRSESLQEAPSLLPKSLFSELRERLSDTRCRDGIDVRQWSAK